MILFKRNHVEPIVSGAKTQTRRAWARCRVRVGAIHWAQTSLRPESRFARLRITAVRQEHLGDLSTQDANREGYGTISEYRSVYEAIYGRFDIDALIWVVDFEIYEVVR